MEHASIVTISCVKIAFLAIHMGSVALTAKNWCAKIASPGGEAESVILVMLATARIAPKRVRDVTARYVLLMMMILLQAVVHLVKTAIHIGAKVAP